MVEKLLLGILSGITITSLGQVSVIETPKPATFTNKATIGFQQNNPSFQPNYNNTNGLSTAEYNNQLIMQEVRYHEQLRARQEKLINEALVAANSSISYSLPSFASTPGTGYFRKAFDEINGMLQGTKPLDLKRAVFLTENAFFGNQMDYNNFDKLIKKDVQLARLLILQKGYTQEEDILKNLALFQYMCDTTEFKDYASEGKVLHLPYTYDFDDFFGRDDWSKMFVTKLLLAKNGQCHSMPLLYLIYAKEIGTEAYLAYSPSHSYIKFKDKYQNWYNLELTSGMLISEAAIMASGYIKTEAIQNGIYMDTISYKQAVSTCLVDLAKGYYHKFGYDSFMLQCADTALKYFPKNIDALQVKSDYYSILVYHVGKQLLKGLSPESQEQVLEKCPKAKEIVVMRNAMYKRLDELGLENMPEEQYQKWLNSIKNEMTRRESRKKVLNIQETIR